MGEIFGQDIEEIGVEIIQPKFEESSTDIKIKGIFLVDRCKIERRASNFANDSGILVRSTLSVLKALILLELYRSHDSIMIQ